MSIHHLKQVVAGVAFLAAAFGAQAAASYGNIAAPPGVYYGAGNVNGDWTIDTSNGVEVALRVKDRATLVNVNGSSGVYQVNPGLCNPTCSGGAKANWNYDFSINLRAGGGVLDLTNVFAVLEVDTNSGVGQTWTTLDVLSNWGDNSYWNGAKRVGSTPLAGEYGVQQSANPLFGNSGFGFLPSSGLYDLRLSVYARGVTGGQGALLAQTRAAVSVPEPGSLALVGLGLIAAASLRKRTQKHTCSI